MALRYLQSTLKEDTLITMTVSQVNHLDEFLSDTEPVDSEEKKKQKVTRMKASLEFDRLFFKRYFDCETFDELLVKMSE